MYAVTIQSKVDINDIEVFKCENVRMEDGWLILVDVIHDDIKSDILSYNRDIVAFYIIQEVE